MTHEVSALEQARSRYRPALPEVLRRGIRSVALEPGRTTAALRDDGTIQEHFPRTFGRRVLRVTAGDGPSRVGPLRAGVVLGGGQAPGGHNVISGLFDALRSADPGSRLIGFLGGSRGIFTGRHRELTAEIVDRYRNTGGFDMIGSGRDKIETEEHLEASAAAVRELELDGLVLIGGDDSNTNAAVLAEYFLSRGIGTAVVGVPKTIDGDLMGEGIEASFGFDTATKVYSGLIGNICRDARSSGKYWHFIKLMGRSASHVTLECALQTRANLALIGEEVQAGNATLAAVVDRIAGVVRRRAEAGKQFGVCLVPEGLIQFIREIRGLIAELNALLSGEAKAFEELDDFAAERTFVEQRLSQEREAIFASLPERIQRQLLLDRDAHGNVRVSQIDTELLLTEKVRQRLAQWSDAGEFSGKFQVQNHFFGYEGRCAAPSNFDADYTYSLGQLAAVLIAFGHTGYICGVNNLAASPDRWEATGVPLTSLMQVETRKGKPTPVIGKALVRLDGEPFRTYAASRDRWEREDDYLFPGTIQYFGPEEVCARPPLTLLLEQGKG
jgi:pyrophosphate--fructose-6-phosphate 1-phosphotransferase